MTERRHFVVERGWLGWCWRVYEIVLPSCDYLWAATFRDEQDARRWARQEGQ